ncbi:MAG: hypothetical protein WBE18_01945 [Gammaproteobacteria bacterium]
MIKAILSNLPIIMIAVFVLFGGLLIIDDERRNAKKAASKATKTRH